ncbi:hypothetical protein [Halarchaeum sp. P4]|uniref:hypothetical protein n=1 Tax=Halarchaeum sp. P4 TaxID=3421639 RepID=UPI003EBEDCC9
MTLARTAAWGAVAALTFLILAFAYHAYAGGPGIAVLVGLAVVVGVAGALGAHAAEP